MCGHAVLQFHFAVVPFPSSKLQDMFSPTTLLGAPILEGCSRVIGSAEVPRSHWRQYPPLGTSFLPSTRLQGVDQLIDEQILRDIRKTRGSEVQRVRITPPGDVKVWLRFPQRRWQQPLIVRSVAPSSSGNLGKSLAAPGCESQDTRIGSRPSPLSVSSTNTE